MKSVIAIVLALGLTTSAVAQTAAPKRTFDGHMAKGIATEQNYSGITVVKEFEARGLDINAPINGEPKLTPMESAVGAYAETRGDLFGGGSQ